MHTNAEQPRIRKFRKHLQQRGEIAVVHSETRTKRLTCSWCESSKILVRRYSSRSVVDGRGSCSFFATRWCVAVTSILWCSFTMFIVESSLKVKSTGPALPNVLTPLTQLYCTMQSSKFVRRQCDCWDGHGNSREVTMQMCVMMRTG